MNLNIKNWSRPAIKSLRNFSYILLGVALLIQTNLDGQFDWIPEKWRHLIIMVAAIVKIIEPTIAKTKPTKERVQKEKALQEQLKTIGEQ